MTRQADLGPLLAAVTDTWEPAIDIVGRANAAGADINPRTGGTRLAALEREGLVAHIDSGRDRADRARLYRRGPNAPPVERDPVEAVLGALRAACTAHSDMRVGQVFAAACGAITPFSISDVEAVERLNAYASGGT